MKEKRTKKPGSPRVSARPEYDFAHGIRGKYAARFGEGTNLVALDRDVAEFFPDSASVNDALRSLVDLFRKRLKTKRSLTASG